ncbi:MAG: tRNA lysidine(34) synthetase TilS [Burkholderiales bacterium]
MTRQRHPADVVTDLRATVSGALAATPPDTGPLAIALSGGRDSVVLLDALAAVAPAAGRALVALHVHHGLSPHADAWERACADLCAQRAIPLVTRRVAVPRPPQASLEAEARRARYAALVAAACEASAHTVALAHHRDDQAETLLLQLLRGAGPHGLAGMAAWRADTRGVAWWRPLLACPRTTIDAYATARSLVYVDDESNASPRHRRNAVRHVVLPALRAAGFPSAAATLARAAAHQADAMHLADDLAALDARSAYDGNTLARAALRELPLHRARNLLRWFLHARGCPPPPAARLADMLAQIATARDDAQVRIVHDHAEIGLHRGRIHVHAPLPPPFALAWCGQPDLALPHGRLRCEFRAPAAGEAAIAAAVVAAGGIEVRLSAGGERLQRTANRPRRALKAILQEAGMPAWERRALPLLVAGGEVIAVPGVGVALRCQAPPGTTGHVVSWHPAPI